MGKYRQVSLRGKHIRKSGCLKRAARTFKFFCTPLLFLLSLELDFIVSTSSLFPPAVLGFYNDQLLLWWLFWFIICHDIYKVIQ